MGLQMHKLFGLYYVVYGVFQGVLVDDQSHRGERARV